MSTKSTTVTASYTATHRAFSEVAKEHGFTPFDVRVLVGIADHGGTVRTDLLSAALHVEASAVRRSSLALRSAGLVSVDAVDGGRVRRGVSSRLALTASGRRLVNAALAHIDERDAA